MKTEIEVRCEYADLDGEGTCNYTNERCRFKDVRNCKNFVEDNGKYTK